MSKDHLLDRLLDDLRHAGELRGDLIWQLVLIAVCVGLAWGVSALLERRLRGDAAAMSTTARMRLRVHELRRLTWPVLALAALIPARALLARAHHVNLMSLAISLLLALVLVRLFLYALRRAFPDNPLIARFGRAVATLIWITVVLDVTGVIPEIVRILDSLSLSVGQETISLWTVLRGSFWVFVAVLVSLWVGAVIENRLMQEQNLNYSLRVGLARLVRALLILLAGLIALPLVGIDLTVLSVFGGALGVGLGFGLQKIASNYVSGFIILFDRSVGVGDLITVENFLGEVRHITTRYVVLRAPDGREAIVPNEKMITETVLNHSLAGRKARVAVNVQVGYRDDLERVLDLARQVAADHPAVLSEPAPLVVVTRFADYGIELELACWVLDAPGGPPVVKSELCVELWRRLRRSGIDIPLPQREIRIVAEELRGSATPVEARASVASESLARRHGNPTA